jgi:hypothetical protein
MKASGRDTPVMEIRLTDKEVAALLDLLEGHFRELSGEITHTDNPGFRQQLREQRDVLLGIRQRLESAGDPGSRVG